MSTHGRRPTPPLTQAEARGITLRDVRVEHGDWSGAAVVAARLERVEFHRVRMTGAVLSESSLTDVRFVDCRVDLAAWRFCVLRNVRLESCRLEEADLYGTTATSVLFAGCDLTRAALADATFTRVEMRGCRLTGIGNPERLRGVRMSIIDVVEAADVIAAAAGIEIVGD
jgi:uncharacterized protein YjbI with pentapeptide repeats